MYFITHFLINPPIIIVLPHRFLRSPTTVPDVSTFGNSNNSHEAASALKRAN